ncbi:uncharacterized protein LOC124262449 [Haliotis rubra]|uniref:uncharacterized protein LOC124262449 n=1 Tax=Haliotis rubra TaxID=36100 RepID=UPI001EE55EDD|nr:uncharacterized protein LOC124262449 [Haliotis rubra]
MQPLNFADMMAPYMISLLLAMEMYSELRIAHVNGQTLSLQSLPSAAVRDDTFQFTCTVTGGGSLLGTLTFQRVGTFISCVVNAGTCGQLNSLPGYTCGCVSGQTRVFYMNIASVTTDDGGTWRCQYSASNININSISNSISLEVLYGPGITSVPTHRQVIENASPDIDCSSNITPGKPSTTRYRWTGPGGYSKNGAVLDRLVTRNQGGVYTCTATNTAGLSDTAQVNIYVQCSAAGQSQPDGLGQGIGIGIGVSLPVILVLTVIIVIMWRRSRGNIDKVNKDQTETIENQPHGDTTPNQAHASLDEHDGYEKLDMGNHDKESEETVGTVGKESVYENQGLVEIP